jgi:hypothetical protein
VAQDTVNNGQSATSAAISVQAGAATSFKLTGTAAPTAGKSFSFTVTAQDAYGNIATSYRGKIRFASTDAQAVFPANYTFTSADNGVHTFSIALKTAGAQTVTVTDTGNQKVTGTRAETVSAAAASQIVILGPTGVTHGLAFSFTVEVLDPYGNLATSYTGTLAFSSSDTAAALPANYTFTAADGGKHTFTATFNTVGTQSLTAKDTLTSNLHTTLAGISVS